MSATLTGELSVLNDWLKASTRTIVAHLAKNPMPLDTEQIVLADLVECDFPGYAPVVLSDFVPQFVGDENYGEVRSGEVEFLASAMTVPQQATAIYLTLAEAGQATKFMDVFPIAPPVTFWAEGDLFNYSFLFQSAGDAAVPTVVDGE